MRRARKYDRTADPACDVVTPNVDEAAAITGIKVQGLDEMRAAAAKLHEMGAVRRRDYRRTSGEGDRPAEFHDEAGDRAGGIQGGAAAIEFDPRHRMCLRDRDGLPPGAGPGTGRGYAAGEDLRDAPRSRTGIRWAKERGQ